MRAALLRRSGRSGLPAGTIALSIATAAVGLGSFAGCSAKHDPQPGEIFLAIDTNLKFPDDLDSIGVSIKNEVGVVSEDQMFPLGSGFDAQFPATLAVIRGTAAPITIRVVGYKGETPITVRETTTTIPANRTALLHMDLDFLNSGLVQTTPDATMVSQLTVSCASGLTPIGGTCQTFTVDSATLPTYDASLIGSSTGAGSIDIDQCMTSGSSVVPATSGCTVPPPPVTSNYGLMLPASAGAGWCNGTQCVVPLENTDLDGWMLESDGLVHLPQGICDKGYPVFTTPTTASCPIFSLQHPALQNYGGTASDAGTPVTDGGTKIPSDAGTVLQRTGATSITADGSGHLYVLTPNLESMTTTFEVFDPPLDLSPSATGTVITLPYPLHGQGPAAVQYPLAAIAVNNENDGGVTNQIATFDVRDAGATQTLYGNGTSYYSSTFATAADGGTVFLYVTNGVGACVVTPGVPADPNLQPFDGGAGASAVASGPGLDGGGPYVAVGSQTAGINAGIFPTLTLLAANPSHDPAQMIFVAGQVVWVDQFGGMYATANAAGGPAGSVVPLFTSGVQLGTGTIAGYQNVLAWVTSALTLYKAELADGGLGSPVMVSTNAVSVTGIGNNLYWLGTDGVINQGTFTPP